MARQRPGNPGPSVPTFFFFWQTWAVAANRFRLAKMFFRRAKQPIMLALVATALLKNMAAHRVRFVAAFVFFFFFLLPRELTALFRRFDGAVNVCGTPRPAAQRLQAVRALRVSAPASRGRGA